MKKQPVYMLTVYYSNKKERNVALGPNQKVLYELGDREYMGRARVEKVSVTRVYPFGGGQRKRK